MKEYGCGQIMIDGYPCTSLGDSPCLCKHCIKSLVETLETAEQSVHRTPEQLDRLHEQLDEEIEVGAGGE